MKASPTSFEQLYVLKVAFRIYSGYTPLVSRGSCQKQVAQHVFDSRDMPVDSYSFPVGCQTYAPPITSLIRGAGTLY